MKIVTFGEVMLRLKSPGFERLFQSPALEATFGGAEANVAVSLANYGLQPAFVTALPKNSIADAALAELRGLGVDTRFIKRQGERMGIYFLEGGANQRASKVITTARARQSRARSYRTSTGMPSSPMLSGSTSAVSRPQSAYRRGAGDDSRAHCAPTQNPGFDRLQLPEEPLEIREAGAGSDA
jgi:hypothetical protein